MIILVLGALLGTQNGRDVDIVNTFELALESDDESKVDHGFLVSRREQCLYMVLCCASAYHILINYGHKINKSSLR